MVLLLNEPRTAMTFRPCHAALVEHFSPPFSFPPTRGGNVLAYLQGQPKHKYFEKKCIITSKKKRTSDISLCQFMLVRQIFCTLTGVHYQERQYSVLLPKKWSSLFFHANCLQYHYLIPVLVCSFLPAEITRKLWVFQNMPFWSRLSQNAWCVK